MSVGKFNLLSLQGISLKLFFLIQFLMQIVKYFVVFRINLGNVTGNAYFMIHRVLSGTYGM